MCMNKIIEENQKSVDFAAKEVNALNDQQAKLKKGICRSPSRPWTKGGDVCLMEHRLKQAESAKAIALQKLQVVIFFFNFYAGKGNNIMYIRYLKASTMFWV